MLHLLIVEIASPSFVLGHYALEISRTCPFSFYTLLVSCAAGSRLASPGSAGIEVRREFRSQEEGSAFGRVERSRSRNPYRRADAACLVCSSALHCCSAVRSAPSRSIPVTEARRVAYLEMYNPANLHTPSHVCSSSIVTSFTDRRSSRCALRCTGLPQSDWRYPMGPVTPFDARLPLPALREANRLSLDTAS